MMSTFVGPMLDAEHEYRRQRIAREYAAGVGWGRTLRHAAQWVRARWTGSAAATPVHEPAPETLIEVGTYRRGTPDRRAAVGTATRSVAPRGRAHSAPVCTATPVHAAHH